MSSTARSAVKAIPIAQAARTPRRRRFELLLTRLGLIVLCIVVLLPAYWVLVASFQVGSSAFSSGLWPTSFTWDNYSSIFDQGFWTWIRNSFVICTVTGVVQLIVNTLGAFAFSRLRFRGRRFGLVALLLLQMFPQMLGLSAIFILLVYLNLLDTYQGIILIYIGGSAFNIWLLKNYMDTVPKEMDESAYVDGANAWQIFWLLVLPLLRHMLVTVFIYGFTGTYNDFIFSSIILQSRDHYTVSVGLFHLIDGNYATNWAVFAAGAVLSSIPILVVYLSLQKQLVAGLASGAVKG